METKTIEGRREAHRISCQHNLQRLTSRLKGIGGVLSNGNPEMSLPDDQITGIGEIILDLAEAADVIQAALDQSGIHLAETNAAGILPDLFSVKSLLKQDLGG